MWKNRSLNKPMAEKCTVPFFLIPYLILSIFGSIYKACIQCTEVILYVIHDHSHKQKMETYHSVKKFVFQSSHIQDKLKSVEAFKMVFHKQRPRLCFMCDWEISHTEHTDKRGHNSESIGVIGGHLTWSHPSRTATLLAQKSLGLERSKKAKLGMEQAHSSKRAQAFEEAAFEHRTEKWWFLWDFKVFRSLWTSFL